MFVGKYKYTYEQVHLRCVLFRGNALYWEDPERASQRHVVTPNNRSQTYSINVQNMTDLEVTIEIFAKEG